jgi:hypothetical protein
MTPDVYGQAVTPAKRRAQSKLAEMLRTKTVRLRVSAYWTLMGRQSFRGML